MSSFMCHCVQKEYEELLSFMQLRPLRNKIYFIQFHLLWITLNSYMPLLITTSRSFKYNSKTSIRQDMTGDVLDFFRIVQSVFAYATGRGCMTRRTLLHVRKRVSVVSASPQSSFDTRSTNWNITCASRVSKVFNRNAFPFNSKSQNFLIQKQ